MNILKKSLLLIPFALFFGAMQVHAFTNVLPVAQTKHEASNMQLLGSEKMSLENRYAVKSVSDVFKDNILLTLGYMSGSVKNAEDVNWDSLHKPTSYEVTLQPGEVFAFHDSVLPQYAGKKVSTTNAHFDASQGFRTDGLYFGDGVCHFASLINWAARDAGLNVVAPTNHDFAVIPEVDRKYGTAIYYSPGDTTVNEQQNLYVENTLGKPVKFVFAYDGTDLKVSVYK
jgi:hypothetical protein